MKYILTIGVFFITVNFAKSQYDANTEFHYTITFEKSTFEYEDAKKVVQDFRDYIYYTLGNTCDFATRFNESGMIYFKTGSPIKAEVVASFFKEKNKTYLAFEEITEKPRLYAFGR